jgi:hypothetical protein
MGQHNVQGCPHLLRERAPMSRKSEYIVFVRLGLYLTTAYVEATDVEAAVSEVRDKMSLRDNRAIEEIRAVLVSEMDVVDGGLPVGEEKGAFP